MQSRKTVINAIDSSARFFIHLSDFGVDLLVVNVQHQGDINLKGLQRK